jgi:hypothetical protein
MSKRLKNTYGSNFQPARALTFCMFVGAAQAHTSPRGLQNGPKDIATNDLFNQTKDWNKATL